MILPAERFFEIDHDTPMLIKKKGGGGSPWLTTEEAKFTTRKSVKFHLLAIVILKERNIQFSGYSWLSYRCGLFTPAVPQLSLRNSTNVMTMHLEQQPHIFNNEMFVERIGQWSKSHYPTYFSMLLITNVKIHSKYKIDVKYQCRASKVERVSRIMSSCVHHTSFISQMMYHSLRCRKNI